ncbi:MAG: hypothetical protein U1E19_10115 [Rhodoblastus sp.]
MRAEFGVTLARVQFELLSPETSRMRSTARPAMAAFRLEMAAGGRDQRHAETLRRGGWPPPVVEPLRERRRSPGAKPSTRARRRRIGHEPDLALDFGSPVAETPAT